MANAVTRRLNSIRSLPDRMPLRVQLVIVLLVLVAFALVITGFAGTTALRGYLLARIDDQLNDTTHIAFQSGRLPGSLEGGGPAPDRSYNNGPALTEGFFTEVTDSSGVGNGILRVPNDSHQTAPKLPVLTLPVVEKHSGKPFTVDAMGTGDNWRVLVSALPDGSGSLVVATSLTDESSTVNRLVFIQLVIGGAVLIVLGLAGYAVVRRSLRKLVEVEKTAGAIAGGDLSQRVDVKDERTEVGRLGSALNTMMGTIESSFAAQLASEAEARESETRMRRFVADASHELRTPLTSIRGFAELQRQQAGLEIEERNRLTGRIEAESTRMSLLVEDLLLLARMDQQRPIDHEPVEMCDLVSDVVGDSQVLAPNHQVTAEVGDTTDEAWVIGDRNRLRQVIANLLSNAYVHTPAGTQINVSVERSEESLAVVVSDDGPGLSDADAQRVFERFFRSDPSRTRASGGSGLGLSIAAAIVAAHGGTITLQTALGEGAAFTVTLPRVRFEHDDLDAEPEELP